MQNPPDRLAAQPEKGRELAISGGYTIANELMVYKGITLLAKTYIFNEDIREWGRQSTEINIWETFKTFFHRAQR